MKFKLQFKNGTLYVNEVKAKRLVRSSSREIFKYDKYIIKLDDGCFGQSRIEARFWPKIRKQDRKYFAPVIQHGEVDNVYYVIQPFVKGKKKRARGKMMVRLIDVCSNYNIEDVVNHQGNYLVNGNIFKIVDYGFAK